MVNYRYVLIILVVIVGAGTAFFYQSDKKKIKKQFDSLSEWVSKDTDENPIITARKAKNIETLFAATCVVEVEGRSVSRTFSPKDISQKVMLYAMQCTEASLQFYDLEIDLAQKTIAQVTATARITGKLKGGEKTAETFELEFLLEKSDKKWLFTGVKAIEVLEK